MRKIVFNISHLGLAIGNSIVIKLVDFVGEPTSLISNGEVISYNQTITLDSQTCEIELWENDNSNQNTHYQLSFNNINFDFKVPSNSDGTTHELTSLIKLSCTDTVCFKIAGNLMFEDDFISKLDLFFQGLEPNFTHNQKAICDMYLFFADNVKDSAFTIDLADALDKKLGSL